MSGETLKLVGGLELPALGLGTAGLNGEAGAQAVQWALEAGYRHLDTAWIYRNEEAVGEGLRASAVNRDDVFVTTKMFPVQLNPRKALEGSLERLGLDHVELYLLHFPAGPLTKRYWRELNQLRDEGLARTVGVSNFSVSRLRALEDAGLDRPVANQVQISPLHHRRALVDYARRSDIVTIGYSPLERGKAFDNEVIAEVAARTGRTPAQVMLRWAIQHDIAVIPRSGNHDRIKANGEVLDFELSADDMAALDRLDQTGGTSKAR